LSTFDDVKFGLGALVIAFGMAAVCTLVFGRRWGLFGSLLWIAVIAGLPVLGGIAFLVTDRRRHSVHKGRTRS